MERQLGGALDAVLPRVVTGYEQDPFRNQSFVDRRFAEISQTEGRLDNEGPESLRVYYASGARLPGVYLDRSALGYLLN